MNLDKSYFFCGIGGSGMMPLALIVQGRGGRVAGSDRTLDQGKLATKFDYLRARGIPLFAQDGSGVAPGQLVVASAAVEESVPDVMRARELGLSRLSRAELLAQLFNEAENGIAVGGTSGKSTVTGMIGWILHAVGRDPTVMNGAVMKNFASIDQPFASALVGSGADFVSEVDESDGSIALYHPKVAVLNNVSLDHKSLDELRHLFGDFAVKADTVVANLDDDETRMLAAALPADKLVSYSLGNPEADLAASDVAEAAFAISMHVRDRRSGETARLELQVPGRHNASNALAALAAVIAVGVPLGEGANALARFTGLRRRFEKIGEAGGVTVIDDFGHNPDKIAATLRTLHAASGRLLIFFQPHGYGPLRAMGRELAATFAEGMGSDDVLVMPDPVYHGGTTDMSVGTEAVTDRVKALGRQAEHLAERSACGDRLVELARPGDRIIVMGARDDTLTTFAEELVRRLG